MHGSASPGLVSARLASGSASSGLVSARLASGSASHYHRWQLAVSLLRLALTAGYLVALLTTGVAVQLADRLAGWTSLWSLQLALALLIQGGAYHLALLPLSWLGGFWLPRRFGLLHQSFRRWLGDGAKGTLIGAALALLATETVYGLLRVTGWWWLWSAAIFLAGYTLLALVAPVWLVPLFYRLSPLPEGDLKARLLALARRAGVPVLGVWVANQSQRSRTANAAVTGLGRTRRIVLFDTLLREFTAEEVEAVLAHEIAHQVHGDVRRGLLIQGALTLIAFWGADHALRAGSRLLALSGPADLGGLPLFGLILLGASLVALPLANAWSRHVERRADDFAVRTVPEPAAFIGAMERLATLNLAERDPHWLAEMLFYSHPAVGRRIERVRKFLHTLA